MTPSSRGYEAATADSLLARKNQAADAMDNGVLVMRISRQHA